MSSSPPSPFKLVLVPAVLTLIVTVVRLTGEIKGWSPRYFSTEPGGRNALVGIVWLVPIFGLWFGWRLAHAGRGPAHPGLALLLHLLAAGAYAGTFWYVLQVMKPESATRAGLQTQLSCMAAGAVGSTLLCLIAWPRLFVTDLCYGLLARLPVVAITYLAVTRSWGTHYEKLGPDDYIGFEPMDQAFWLSFAQLTIWPAFTIVVGGFAGSLAALVAKRRSA